VNERKLNVGSVNNPRIHYNNTHEITVFIDVWTIELENVDGFLNIRSVQVAVDLSELTSHGLLGQTWNTKMYPGSLKHIEGNVDDYLLAEKSLFGIDFLFNQFSN
jgi:hypothetical protein